MKVKLDQIVKCLVAVCLIVFVIVDFVYDRKFTDQSLELTLSLQRWGGDSLKTAGDLLSTVFTYWIFVYFHLYVVFNKDHEYMIYTIISYFLPLITVLILKALYYQGRPYVISKDVSGCECDPGMPSGHSCMAVMAYSILYDQCRRLIINKVDKKIARRISAGAIGVFCVSMAALVAFSRITLGVHSYPQLIIGGSIGIVSNLFFTYEIFKRIMLKLIPVRRLAASLFGAFAILFSIGMLFINHYTREELEYWKYFDKCPKCQNSFIRGQSESLSLMLFPTFFVLSIMIVDPVVNKAKKPLNENPRLLVNSSILQEDIIKVQNTAQPTLAKTLLSPPAQTPETRAIQANDQDSRQHIDDSDNSNDSTADRTWTKLNLYRYLLLLAVTVPGLLSILIFELVVKPHIHSLVGQSIAIFLFYGFAYGWLGTAVSGLKNLVYRRCRLLTKHDLISVDRLNSRARVPDAQMADMIDVNMPHIRRSQRSGSQNDAKVMPS